MESVERAMKAVFQGPEVKKLGVFDHEFNVKPAEITRAGKQCRAVGQISHHLSFRPDDQVYYTIVKEGDIVKTVDIKIAHGGGTLVAAPLLAVVGSLVLKKPITPDQIEPVGRLIGKQLDGSWEEVAHLLVTNIAMRL